MAELKQQKLAEDHEVIYLGPLCQTDERTWCEHDQGNCEECELPWVKYVRAPSPPASDVAKRLEEIRKRADAATKGPWHLDFEHDVVVHRGGDAPIVAMVSQGDFEFDELRANAAHIANARSDIPFLLTLIEQLTAEKSASEEREGRMRAALEPFARIKLLKPEYSAEDSSGLCIEQVSVKGPDIEGAVDWITVGDIRAARAALTPARNTP